ncbi:NYN domain-containing protein [Nostoc sp.]|uniref:NYN domain-containing protein n=1 Tax=Nostoc sp. TaxID=1180 RepID=UPI002FFD5684
MLDTHITSNRTSHKQLNVLIYWDYQNAKLNLELAKLLLVFAKSRGRLIGKNIYYNSQCEDQAAAKNNLASGDGDFVNLVRNLQNLGKRVIIFAQAGNVKQKLKELADEFYFINKLPELIDKKTKS